MNSSWMAYAFENMTESPKTVLLSKQHFISFAPPKEVFLSSLFFFNFTVFAATFLSCFLK